MSYREEAEEIDRLTPEELRRRWDEGEEVELRVAPNARMWVWRDGRLVPLPHESFVPGMTVIADTGWLPFSDWNAR